MESRYTLHIWPTMNPETVNTVTTIASTGTGTKITESFIIIGGIVAAAMGIAWPIIQVIRKFSSDKDAAIRRNQAEITLYQQLKEQLEINKKNLDEALRENRRLWEIIKDLQSRLEKIEQIESNFEKIRRKLDHKDMIISQRNAEIAELRNQLQAKDEKIKNLEIRVVHLETLLERK